MNQCPNCGMSLAPNTTRCIKCGAAVQPMLPQQPDFPPQPQYQMAPQLPPQGYPQPEAPLISDKSRTAFILLAIFLGGLGIHNFYAGFSTRGVIQLLITLLTCGWGGFAVWIWAIVEAVTVTKDAKGRQFS